MTFNEKYKLKNSFEYININLDSDTETFVDPYLIYISRDDFSIDCSNRIVRYFTQLLDAAKNNNQKKGYSLVEFLKENNEVHLGYSRGKPAGKSLGPKTGMELYKNIQSSKATKSGLVKDIFDASIMLPNVNQDKISDLTISIILEKLIDFTQHICIKYNIPMIKQKLLRPVWSDSQNKWIKLDEVLLPEHNGDPIILIPQVYSKRYLVYTCRRFYNNEMMPYYEKVALQNPDLGLIKILKRGTILPARQKIRAAYPCTKNNVIAFILEHPELYDRYKAKELQYVTLDNV